MRRWEIETEDLVNNEIPTPRSEDGEAYFVGGRDIGDERRDDMAMLKAEEAGLSRTVGVAVVVLQARAVGRTAKKQRFRSGWVEFQIGAGRLMRCVCRIDNT
jgi:hypothetical protein